MDLTFQDHLVLAFLQSLLLGSSSLLLNHQKQERIEEAFMVPEKDKMMSPTTKNQRL